MIIVREIKIIIHTIDNALKGKEKSY